jgi:hypothetical protein
MDQVPKSVESIQKLVARTVSLSPAGEGLALVGGFRYRLLDGSARFSADVDYHWSGDGEVKKNELAALLRTYTTGRDLLDLTVKLEHLKMGRDAVAEAIRRVGKNRAVHIKAIRLLLDTQVEEGARKNIDLAGGQAMIFDSVNTLLLRNLAVEEGIGT